MTEKEFDFLLYGGLVLIVVNLVYKFLFWIKARKIEKDLPGFLMHLIIWYSSYNMYDSWSYDIKFFMKVNNQTNKLIWLGSAMIIVAVFSFKYLKGLVS